MLASQLIYTSYKNGDRPQKGYMVYSKSEDITAEEESEILSVMRYNPPSDLPLTPSEEEIKERFPKNFAYFRLSSGRYCIAQSCYGGQDYSTRWGNYIIHAFVTDDIGELVPADLIGMSLFRTKKLTDEENEAPAPASLPRVELPEVGEPLFEDEIKTFFKDPARATRLGQLLQNMIDAFPGEKQIRLYDALEHARYWIGALSLLLPKALLKDFYFSTYVNDSLSTDLLKLSCMLPNPAAQMMYLGNIVPIYAAQNGDYGAVRAYADTVCQKLLDCREIGIQYVRETERLMERYETTDLDRTVKLVALSKGEGEIAASAEELKDLTQTLLKNEDTDCRIVAQAAFRVLSVNETFRTAECLIDTFRLIYPHLSEESQNDLLMLYVDLMLLRHAEQEPIALAKILKESAPTAWESAVKRMVKEAFMSHLASKKSDAADLLAAFVWIDAYPLYKEEVREKVLEKISALYQRFVKEKKLTIVKEILSRVAPLSDKSFLTVYRSILKTETECFLSDVGYLFDYLALALKSGGAFWTVLRNVLALYPDLKDQCIEAYVRLMKDHPDVKADFARYAEKYADIGAFLEGTAVYEYENESVDSQKALLSGYETCVLRAYTDGAMQEKAQRVFLRKLQEYLKQRNAKDRIREGMYLYEKFLPKEHPSEYETQILSSLFQTVFGESALKDLAASVEQPKLVEAMIQHAKALHFGEKAILCAELFVEGSIFCRAAQDPGNRAILKAIWMPSQSGEYKSLAKELPQSLRTEFFEEYFDAVLKTVYALSDDGAKDFSRLIHSYIRPFAVLEDAFDKRFTKLLKKDPTETNRYIHFYFQYAFDETHAFADRLKNRILEDYLTSLNKNMREETFALLSDRMRESAPMKTYISEYQKNHKSIWDRLTGFFSGKKDDRDKKEHKGDMNHGKSK